MTDIKQYEQPKASGWDQTSPFVYGDRVNTLLGTGTIYQSGAYHSWVVLDTDWAVHHVRTEFVVSLRDDDNEKLRLQGVEPGFPNIDQLRDAGYQLRNLVWITHNGQGLDLGQALSVRDAARSEFDEATQATFRVISIGTEGKFTVVEATREEPEPYSPIGLG